MNYLSNKKILLTGGGGFLGRYVERALVENGVKKENITIPSSKKCDLKILENVKKVIKNKDIVIHLAGIVGGIGFNQKYPAKMIYDNLLMGLNLFEQARLSQVKKFIMAGTVCCYPKFTPVPFKEENLWNGYPEETNAPYGIAKKTLMVLGNSYRSQYNLNSIFLIPTNLYGPGDNFDLLASHVIPSLIRKISQAQKYNQKYIEVWGTGKATREFLYVGDCAKAIVLAMEKYNKPAPINIGSGFEISIKDLVSLISKLMNFKGKVVWKANKPDGQPRRCLDTTKAFKEFGFKAETDFVKGLKLTIKWYHEKFNRNI